MGREGERERDRIIIHVCSMDEVLSFMAYNVLLYI